MKASITRLRLAAAAAELFYAHGITASGVDAVVLRAGVSKPTLYSHYQSKADLVTAALEFQHHTRRQAVEEFLRARSDLSPHERLLSVFDWLQTWYSEQGTRGCAFLNAAAELVDPQDEPARKIVQRHKRWWRELFIQLAKEGGVTRSRELADGLLLLVDGVSSRVLVMGEAGAASTARQLADILWWHYRDPASTSPGTGNRGSDPGVDA
ncbi:MAG: TetR/AcrR family transcriptional regulator [Thermaerobacter sp.]|nr:TetR/AcrR family transcriptional regulator [Thermaerobacter sp.]